MNEKEKIILDVIEEPPDSQGRTVLRGADLPILEGQNEAAPDVVCGFCGEVLVTGLTRAETNYVVLLCPSCGAYNDTA